MFKVDKTQSLEIMQEILSHLRKKRQVSYNQSFDCKDISESDKNEDEDNKKKDNKDEDEIKDERTEIVNFKHKLAIIELQLELEDSSQYYDINECEKEFNKAIEAEEWNRSKKIEIHYGSRITDKIELLAYLHETKAECDLSQPTFTYNEKYQCWIVEEDFWDAPYGIDGDNVVTILDFSEYQNQRFPTLMICPICKN